MLVIWPLDENKGPSQLHGHGPWLVCQVTMSSHSHTTMKEPLNKLIRTIFKYLMRAMYINVLNMPI